MHPHNIYRMKLTFIGFQSDTGKDNNKNGYCVSLFFLNFVPKFTYTIFMGGFFGVISKTQCVADLFYGTDYNSHLGTRRGIGYGYPYFKGVCRPAYLENDQECDVG